MIPRPFLAVSAVIALASSLWAPAQGQETESTEVFQEKGRTYLRIHRGAAGEEVEPAGVPDRLIVKLRPGRDKAFLQAVPGARKLGNNSDLLLVPLPPGLEAREAARRYAKLPEVLYAEPDAVASLAAIPNDTRWSEQWNMVKIGAPAAWDTQTSSSDVVVAVLDTGINFAHPDLQPNVWTNPLDGSHGFTCLNGTVTPGGQDDNGHGTHVAGVVGAMGNDGLGVAGVNWSVQLLSLKAFNSSGNANTSDILLCIDKLVELKQSGINIRVSNHSWTTTVFSQALQEALVRAENAGVLQVCAAGNNGRDLDFTPYYPAAFDGHGILAVAATDSGDLPASFSNFGHAAVDLAAPGVDVLSTVPSGTCISCDASGYKLLSGTSMATPHVSGVAAALFHLNPGLTPAEARDILLQPAGADALSTTSVRAASTTRARLSFAKALAHPWLTAPRLNGFPQMSAPGQVTRSAGSTLTLAATASDSDGDPLSYQWGKNLESGLYGNMLNQLFPPGWVFPPTTRTNPYIFTVPSLAVPVTMDYRAAVNDGRGGSAAAQTWVNVQANPIPGQAPSGTLTVTPTSGPPGTVVTVSYSGTDPEGGSLLWGYNSGGAGGTCCYSTTQTFTHTIHQAGVYRFNGQSIDRELSLSPISSVVVRIGDAVGEPPVVSLTLDVASGPAPLTVSYDATGTYDPDGGTLTFYPVCGVQTGWISLQAGPPTGTCAFDEPGPNQVEVYVQDASGYWDVQRAYVTVLGSFSPDTVAPAVQITSPASGASVTGTVAVNVSASDNEVVKRVELYLDSGVLLGTDTTAPYGVTWNTVAATMGPHTLYAKAYDESGNAATSADVSVTVVDTAPPSVSILSPAFGRSIPNNSPITISASASDPSGVARVELYRDSGVLLGTDTVAPYSLDWTPTALQGSHTLYARAYDEAGNSGTSSTVGVIVVDLTPPAVSITSPAGGSTIPNNAPVTISAAASDDIGVVEVSFFVNSILLGTDTTTPYSLEWNPATATLGSHSFYARAYDGNGNSRTSTSVSVTVADATPPTVSITSPSNGGTVPKNTTVTISASASDNVGVTRVEFFVGSTLTCTDTTSPYTCAWRVPKTAGASYSLQTKAYDARNNLGTSTTVVVTAR